MCEDNVECDKKEEIMQELYEQIVLDNMTDIFKFIIVLIIGFIIIKLLNYFVGKSKVINKLEPTVRIFLKGLTKFLLYATYLIVLLSVAGVPMTTFIAMMSAIGLAIGLALQGNLSNFASAIMILVFKPFKIGDVIESQGSIGTVQEIQILFTHILTFDNRKVIIPNSELVNARIINYTSESSRRIDLVFGASYENDVEQVKEVLQQVVDNHESILKEPAPIIRLTNHNSSSLDYDVKVWVDKTMFWPVRYDLLENVQKAFEINDIKIPYPQHEIWMANYQETERSKS